MLNQLAVGESELVSLAPRHRLPSHADPLIGRAIVSPRLPVEANWTTLVGVYARQGRRAASPGHRRSRIPSNDREIPIDHGRGGVATGFHWPLLTTPSARSFAPGLKHTGLARRVSPARPQKGHRTEDPCAPSRTAYTRCTSRRLDSCFPSIGERSIGKVASRTCGKYAVTVCAEHGGGPNLPHSTHHGAT